MKTYRHLYQQVTTFDNLRRAFKKAARGKRKRPDVADFEYNLEAVLEPLGLMEKLAQVDRMMTKIRLYLRLSYDLKCIGLGQYEFAARQMDEIGRSIATTTSVFGVLRRQEIGNGLLTTDSVTD